MSEYRKAWAALLGAALTYLLTAATTGDWAPTDPATLVAAVTGLAVYFVPNEPPRGPLDREN